MSFRNRERSWSTGVVGFAVLTVAWLLLVLAVFTNEHSDVVGSGIEPWTNRLYVVDAGHRKDSVMIVDIRRSRERVVQSVESGAQVAIAVSADGSRLVAVSRRCGAGPCGNVMSVIDTRWGSVERTIPLSWPAVHSRVARTPRTPSAPSIALSPDGRFAFLWVRGDGRTASIGTVDVDTGTVLPETAHPPGECRAGSPLVPLAGVREVAIACGASARVRLLTIDDGGGLQRLDTVALPAGIETMAGAGRQEPGHPVAATTSGDLRLLFVATSIGRVSTIDLTTRALQNVVDLRLPAGRLVASGASLSFSDTRNTLSVSVRPTGEPLSSVADMIVVVDVSSWTTLAEITPRVPFEAMTRTPDDGSLLVYGTERPGVRAVDPMTGSEMRVLPDVRRPRIVVVPLFAA